MLKFPYKYLFVILLLLLQKPLAFAQNVSISGQAKGGEGKNISVKLYTDYFTFNDQVVATATIDSSGSFDLKCNIPETTIAVIQVDYYTGEMYLEPNKNYQIEIQKLHFDEKFDRINHYLNPLYCVIKVKNENRNELNNLIQRLNINYNLFIRDHVKMMNTPQILFEVDTFLLAMNDTFAGVNQVFFTDYLRYRMASLKLLTAYTDSYKLLLDYFFRKPILYNNIEYFSFLNDCFEHYFKDLTHQLSLSDLDIPVNINKSASEMMDVLGKDTLFINEIFRELVMLKTLDMLYAQPGFNKEAVMLILQQFPKISKSEKHKKIAESIYRHHSRYYSGTEAPGFTLKDANDSIVSLEHFRGKMVYINFFATWCLSCMDEMELMRQIYNKYAADVVFVSICCDREYMKMYHFVREQKYPWIFLHLNSNYKLIEDYAVYAYPSFALIDGNGKFMKCPVIKPSDNIDLLFKELLSGKK